jgi:hypothetical protein
MFSLPESRWPLGGPVYFYAAATASRSFWIFEARFGTFSP